MLQKGVVDCLPIILVIMASALTTAAYGPNSQFRRDRRAIRARTTATGEDHIAHASIKMRMMNEGRSQQAVNPVRAKRFINPASGSKMNKVSEAFKEYSGNRFGQVFPGKGRASELVDQIQHGYVQPPRAPFPKDAVYKDLLTRQRKDGQHPSGSSEKPSQVKDDVDEFLQFMHEMGILGNPADNVFKGSKQQGNTDEKPPSAAAFVNHHIHRPAQNADDRSDDIAMRAPSSRVGGKAESHQSSAVVHPLPRPSNHDVSEVKRQSFSPFSEETEEEEEEGEVVALQEEAIINIPPQTLAKSDIGNHGLAGVDLEIIKQLLEEILARKSQGSKNI